jgi:hypothetical protein
VDTRDEPTIEEALRGNERMPWWIALKEEYDSLILNQTWSAVDYAPKKLSEQNVF